MQETAERDSAVENHQRAAALLPAIQRRRAFLQNILARGDRVAQPLGLGFLSAQLIGERRQLCTG